MAKINFLECDLETIIENTPLPVLINRGLDIEEHYGFLRQQRIGDYGIADLISINAFQHEGSEMIFNNVCVYELKQNEINLASLLQVSRYIKGIPHFLHSTGHIINNVTGVLIGKMVDLKSDFIHLAALCPNISIYTYRLDVNGFWFDKIIPHEYTMLTKGNAENFVYEATDHMRRWEKKLFGEEEEVSIEDNPFK